MRRYLAYLKRLSGITSLRNPQASKCPEDVHVFPGEKVHYR
jgi:hypothetical protein